MKRLILLALLTAFSLLSQSRMHSRAVNGTLNYCSDAGTTDDYTCTVGLIGYVTGQQFVLKPNTSNTGAATLNVDSLGAKTIVYNDSVTLLDNILVAGKHYLLEYDGTNMVLPFSSKFVLTNQANTYTAGAQTFTSAASLTVPNSAAYAPTATGSIGYDSTKHAYVGGRGDISQTGTFQRVVNVQGFTGTIAAGDCLFNTGTLGGCTNIGTTETAFATTYSIPASWLLSQKMLRPCVAFDYSSGGTAVTVVLKMRLGGTAVYNNGTGTPATGFTTISGMGCFTVIAVAGPGASVNVYTFSDGARTNNINLWNNGNTVVQPVLLATNGALSLDFAITYGGTASQYSFRLLGMWIEEQN